MKGYNPTNKKIYINSCQITGKTIGNLRQINKDSTDVFLGYLRNLDIRYGYNSNYCYETVLLFDPKTKEFKKINGIDEPENSNSKNIKGTDFYFSHAPNGCGKNNWISRLLLIQNNTITPLGLIDYKQCDGDNKGIYVFQLTKGKPKLISKLTLPQPDNFDFEKYWIKNYKKLIE